MISIRLSLACLTLGAAAAGPALGQMPASSEALPLGGKALIQLERILQEKSSRNEAQRKLATPLVYAARELKKDAVMRDLPTVRYLYRRDESSRVEVDLKAEVKPALLEAIEREGGSVVSSYPQYHAVRAFLPLAAVERLAE